MRKNSKRKTKIKFPIILNFFVLLILAGIIFSAASSALAQYNYTPLEPIPGFETTTGPGADQFKNFVEGIYKFGIWAVGIAALLMITIGGFTYMTSAGNTAKAGAGKEIIKNAIFGLVVALLAWLGLNIINPDLLNVTITMPAAPAGQTGASPTSPQSGTPSSPTRSPAPSAGTAPANCTPLANGPCSTSSLSSTCFGSNAQRMSSICHVESNGIPTASSTTDRCVDGSSWSVGLFQVNMIAHSSRMGYNSRNVFQVNGSGPQGTCLQRVQNSNGVGYCAVRDCRVIDQAAYNDMRTRLQDPTYNTQIACQISNNGNNIRPGWTTTANVCHL